MKNELIKRNILITLLTSLIFLVMSFFIMSYSNKKSLEKELVYVSNLLVQELDNTNKSEIIDRVNALTKDQEWLTVEITDKIGEIIYNSENDSIGNDVKGYIDINEVAKANNSLDSDRLYTIDNRIYYINEIDYFLIRTSVKVELETNYILLSVFFMLVLLVLQVFLTYKTSNITIKNVLNTFNNIETNLKDINSNETKDVITTDYEEVEPIVKEINKISKGVKNSFKTLENEKNKLLLVVNRINEGIIILNKEKDILIINDKASLILNKNKEELENKKISEFFNDEIIDEYLDNIIKNKNTMMFDYKTSDHRFIYNINLNYLNISWDIINNINEIIVVAINDVTVDRKASKVKSDFISNASHELKTPVTSIKGFSELLSLDKDKYDTDTKNYIERIKKESERIVNLVDELIYLSNLEYFDESKICDKIYIKDITLDITESLRNNELNVEIIDETDDSYIITEETLFYRLLKNLIENGVKYNKENGKVIIKSYKENGKIILIVEDTGIGIEAKNLDRIYERFYRVDKSRSSSIPGTGLGLNIVKESVTKMNAKISVESVVNKGTKFIIEFNESNGE